MFEGWGAALAVGAGAVVGAGATIVSGNRAAGAQRDAARQASDTDLAMYDQNREDLAPYREVGAGALSQLASGLGIAPPASAAQREAQNAAHTPVAIGDSMLPAGTTTRPLGRGQYDVVLNGQTIGLLRPGGKNGRFVSNGTSIPTLDTPNGSPPVAPGPAGGSATPEGYFNHDFTLADFHKDPGYDFRMQSGQDALERSAASRGGLLNGGTIKALTRYGQDYGSQEYSNAYSRFNADRTTRFNRLSSLAGTGQTATNTTAALGSNAAGKVAEAQLQAGNARAANAVNTGSAINGAASSLGNYYLQQQYLSKIPKAG